MKRQLQIASFAYRRPASSCQIMAIPRAHQRDQHPHRTGVLIPLFGLAFFLAASIPANAAPDVAPGATHVFSTPDGGETECRIEALAVACGFPFVRFSGTDFDTGTKEVSAVFSPVVGTVGEANHASASLFNDFTITDASLTASGSDGVISAHVSAAFDYRAFLLGAAAYTVDAELNLVISDVTGGAPGVPVASLTLATRDRSGDQGFTDVSVGGQSVVLTNEGSGFTVLLRRGHTYRITFQATAYGASLLVGAPSSDVTAMLNDLRVTLDDDEVELLIQHDMDIKDALATHDHDVKQLLHEVIRHLHTPNGRRTTDTPACDGGPCDYPYKPSKSSSAPIEADLCTTASEGSEVDANSCTLEDFCALQKRLGDCSRADWQDDEAAGPRDCRWRSGACEPR